MGKKNATGCIQFSWLVFCFTGYMDFLLGHILIAEACRVNLIEILVR